ncbi:MAG: hypothetical protein F6J97_26925, partial [Leptolyngbya sp. SIO4C1]|nr:hypothetical protein [Leptolyngbya sp. SIO4C1]
KITPTFVSPGVDGMPTSGADEIWGFAGDDTLDGGGGADTLIGGKGNEHYYVDNAEDVVTENSNEGIDRIFASVNYALPSHVEHLHLGGSKVAYNGDGNSLDNGILGNPLDNYLKGLGGRDTLLGYQGNDTLDGGQDADIMVGGQDNDTYYVDRLDDRVSEVAGEGTDTVIVSVNDYTLSDHVENLTLAGNTQRGYGNALNNYILGNDNNNVMTAGGGVDTLEGKKGNDTYYLDSAQDSVIEKAGEGTDEVFTSANDYTLADHVENLYLIGNAQQATGNALDNVIIGNAQDNIITGGIGDDTMQGKTGGDAYYVDSIGDTVVEKANGLLGIADQV